MSKAVERENSRRIAKLEREIIKIKNLMTYIAGVLTASGSVNLLRFFGA